MLAAGESPAGADPPGPTDYRSEVIAVEPPTESIDLRFIGGDSFIELTVTSGHEVIVAGYQGEPYLRFGADGAVEENRRSPATVLNDDRYGSAELPATVDASAAPDWVEVGGDGRYAWHDHRTHWMNSARPPGRGPGDQILEAVVPLTVDGAEVDVVVASYWVDGPSAATWVLLAAIGVVAAVMGFMLRRWAAVVAAAVALASGMIAFVSVPAETGPSRLLWVVPLVALVCGAAAAGFSGGQGTKAGVAPLFALLAGAELLLWGWIRREAVVRAIVPTDAPITLDRAVVVATAAVGVIVVAWAAIEMFRTPLHRDGIEVSSERA